MQSPYPMLTGAATRQPFHLRRLHRIKVASSRPRPTSRSASNAATTRAVEGFSGPSTAAGSVVLGSVDIARSRLSVRGPVYDRTHGGQWRAARSSTARHRLVLWGRRALAGI